MGNFINRLTREENGKAFSDAIKKSKLKTFESSFPKAKVSKNGKQREIKVQSDILGRLVTSCSRNAAINLNAAMSYPLAAVACH